MAELTVEAIHNAKYRSTDLSVGEVQLKDCVANDYKTGRQIHGMYQFGRWDFDGDGVQDVATLVAYKRDRRSSERFDLVILADRGGHPEQIAAIDIGGPYLIRELRVVDGVLLLDMSTDKVCDEISCGYRKRELRRYSFDGRALSFEYSRKSSLDDTASIESALPHNSVFSAAWNTAARFVGLR